MEMNTRLQVEHPVTEMITGRDLVEWQLRVAAGEALPQDQASLSIGGHAFEARLYAEDPARGFLPATGRLARLRFPAEDAHIRVDSGVVEGDEVSAHYDPMIAKIVAWDRDRASALRRLGHALRHTEVVGVTTNRDFLLAVAEHPAFAEGAVDTGFIDRHRDALIPGEAAAPDDVLALAALGELLHRSREAAAHAAASSDFHSPWALANGWRLNMETHSDLRFLDAGREVAVSVFFGRQGLRLELPGTEILAHGEMDDDGHLVADLGGRRLAASVVRRGAEVTVIALGRVHHLRRVDPLAAGDVETGPSGALAAPMPGKVIDVLVQDGSQVARGATLMILEAMKMEHTIRAPGDGIVRAVHFQPGDSVAEGAELIDFEADDADGAGDRDDEEGRDAAS
jgi:3-methylcrotonyl-CoA carboxylase alpha subunit